jgi:hypothetical protein
MDPWIVLLLGLLFKSENINMEELPMDGLKAKIKESIEKKLENPDISASDIKILAEAYAELTKNDYIKELWSNPMFGPGFGGYIPPDLSKEPSDKTGSYTTHSGRSSDD